MSSAGRAEGLSDSYVRSAASLQESIGRNRYDTNFAEQNNEIVYIFDTNMFVFEADLLDERRLTVDIDNLVGRTDAEIARVLERLTARFLFSGGLPGQLEGCAYITLPHFEESLDIAKVIASNYDNRRTKQPSPLDTDEVRDAVLVILEGPATPEQKLLELGELLPKAWLETLDAKAHFRRVLRESFVDPGNLVPLDKVEWGREASAISPADVQPWLNALPEPSAVRSSDHIRADGLTLATIINLYRNDEFALGSNRERMYVLVTSDRAIASAVRKRMPILRAQGIPYFVRSPADYLPLLNLNGMSIALSGVESNPELRAAFRSIFEALSSAIDWIALMSREGGTPPRLFLDRDPLKHLQRTWSTISHYIAALNVPYVADLPWMFDDIKAYLTPSTKLAAANIVETSVQEVSDQHLQIVIDATLAHLKQSNDERQSGHRRVHVQVLGDIFGSLIADGDIDGYLTQVTEQGALTHAVREALGKETDRAEVQLLAACVFIAADRWNLASQAALRGYEKLENSKFISQHRFDARYLVAHCLRFSMRSMTELQRAENLLDLNLQDYRAHEDSSALSWRRRLRDEMEYGSLLITAAVLNALSGTVVGRRLLQDDSWHFFSDISARTYLEQGVKKLVCAMEEIEEAQPLLESRRNSTRDQQFVHALKRMGTTNLVEALLFEQIGPGLQGDRPIFGKESQELVAKLGKFIKASHNAPLLLTHHIYYWRARHLFATSAEERAETLEKLQSYLKGINPSHSLPLIDLLEFQFIERQLRVTPHE